MITCQIVADKHILYNGKKFKKPNYPSTGVNALKCIPYKKLLNDDTDV